jgi:hypothetical protein
MTEKEREVLEAAMDRWTVLTRAIESSGTDFNAFSREVDRAQIRLDRACQQLAKERG